MFHTISYFIVMLYQIRMIHVSMTSSQTTTKKSLMIPYLQVNITLNITFYILELSQKSSKNQWIFSNKEAKHKSNLTSLNKTANRLRPRLQEYVFIENDVVFNENATIVLHLQIVFVSFSCHF